VIKNILSHN